jgi:hypothetical protein
VMLSQPLPQARRQQTLLISIASHKVERHRSLLPPEEHATSMLGPPAGRTNRFMRQPPCGVYWLPPAQPYNFFLSARCLGGISPLPPPTVEYETSPIPPASI